MSEHLTQNQVEGYCRQRLSAAEVLSVSDHLEVCEACAREVEKALDGDAAFLALRSEVFDEAAAGVFGSTEGSDHPTIQELAEYIDGVPAGAQLQLIGDHLASCNQCGLAVDDLRAFKKQVAPELLQKYQPSAILSPGVGWWHRLVGSFHAHPPRSPALAFGSALALIFLVVTGWLVWRTRQVNETKPGTAVPSTATPGATSTVSPAPAPDGKAVVEIAQLNDSGNRIGLDREDRLSGVDNLPPDYQRMVKDALATRRLEKSSQLAGLRRPESPLMGGDVPGDKLSVIEPVGRVMLSDRPTFHWSSLEGSTGYVVEIFDDQFDLVVTSPRLKPNSWTSPQSLKRGRIYSWQVRSARDGQEFISPHPPAPQAKFRVLDQAKADEIAQAQRAYASSHLTLGLLYVQAGLLDEAQRELHVLQMDNPDSGIVRRWLADLQTMQR